MDRHGCTCCHSESPVGPEIFEMPVGHGLNKSFTFDDSIVEDIPDSAEKMRWLKRTFNVTADADVTDANICGDSTENPDNWWQREQRTREGVYHYATYNPADGSLGHEGGGTETYLYELRGTYSPLYISAACEVSPDNTITDDKYWTGTWDWSDENNRMELTWAGTENGEEISGVTLEAVDWIANRSDIWTRTVTLDTSGISVKQTDSREWAAPDWFGTEILRYGYEDPYFRYRITIPEHTEVRFMEVEWEVWFAADGGEEELLETATVIWRDGDPSRDFDYAPDYPDFGTWRIRITRYRSSPVALWQTAVDQEITTA